MHFKRTEIQNFKSIEKMSLNFSSGVNLLIGDNGVGKTTVLEALALSVQTYFSRMNDITKKGITQKDVRFTSSLVGDASQHRMYYTPTTIKSTVELGGVEYSSEISREDETNATRTKYAGKELAAAGRELLNSQTEILPVICYFSTSRVVDTQKASTSSVGKNKLNDRRCGYMDCLNATLDRKALTDWAFKMAMAEYKKGMPIAEYEAFKKAVGTFMQKMNDLDEIPLVEYTRDFEDITYTENEKTEILATLEGEKYTLQRSKGLGENEADMMALTTMNPETRRLIQVTAAGIEETAKMFDILLGDDLQGRKDFIAEYGSEYLELADIS